MTTEHAAEGEVVGNPAGETEPTAGGSVRWAEGGPGAAQQAPRQGFDRGSWASASAPLVRRVIAFCRGRAVAFGELWRHSLQFRVTVSTLALSSAVVFVLGMVLQTQITTRLTDTKRVAAEAQTRQVVGTAESELIGLSDQDALSGRLMTVLQ